VNPERRIDATRIVDAALARPATERALFVAETCEHDEELRREVESLLARASAGSESHDAPEREVAPGAGGPDPMSAAEAPTRTVTVDADAFRPSVARSLADGQPFGPYRIERLLGRGGMGEVYAAEERETGRRVALKVLRRTPFSAADRARFLREGRLAASVSHPHVVFIFGSTEVDGTPVIAMELVPGGTLKDRVHTNGPLKSAESVDAILQVIAGLEAAAAAGILHRDIKPSNCFVDSAGHVKVGDFGLSISTLARTEPTLTEHGTFVGTPAFAAPEQLRGEALDVRSDIYAVGATLFYLLTDRAPIEETDLVRFVARIAHEPPPSPRQWQPAISKGLAAIVVRCLAKSRSERFESYADLAAALEPFGSTASSPPRISLRAIAGLIDFTIIGGLSRFIGPLLPVSVIVHEQSLERALRSAWWPGIFTVLTLIVSTGYFGLLEGIWQSSVGKRVCGIRVATSDGAQLGIGRAWARAGVFAFGALAVSAFLRGRLPRSMLSLMLTSPIFPISVHMPGHTLGSSIGAGLFPITLLLLFVTARHHNGFAGIHELLTKTRAARARGSSRGIVFASTVAERIAPGTGRVGPYALLATSTVPVPPGFLVGYDRILARYVWIQPAEPGSASVAPKVRDLARRTRVRWLAGRRAGAEAWDAYEAIGGQALLQMPKQPWSTVEGWVKQLAQELALAIDDGTLPELSVNRVWIGADRRARLLNWPAADIEPGDTFLDAPGADQVRAQGFLLQVAATTLEARTAPLPLSATRFLRSLAEAGFADARATAEAAASLGQPRGSSRSLRATHLGACALGVFLAADPIVRIAIFQNMSSTSLAHDGMLLQTTVAALIVYDHWEQQSASPVIVQRRKALEIYLAGRLRAAIERTRDSAELLTQTSYVRASRMFPTTRDDVMRRLDELLQRSPPSAAEMSRAEGVLRPLRFAFYGLYDLGAYLRQSRRDFYLLFFSAMAAALLGILVSPFVSRGGLFLRWLGFAVVTSDGNEVSRTRALCRALIGWLPAIAYILLAAHQAIGFLPRYLYMGSDPIMALLEPLRWPVTGMPLIVLAIVATGGLWAVCRPARGIQEWLTGTWLVPR
jgi:serine/threonine protein kinase